MLINLILNILLIPNRNDISRINARIYDAKSKAIFAKRRQLKRNKFTNLKSLF